MKRETYGLAIAAIFVSIVVMHTNNTIGEHKLEAALSQAASMKIANNQSPAEHKVPQTTATITEENDIAVFTFNFGSNTEDTDPKIVTMLQTFLSEHGYMDLKYITGEFGPRTKEAVINFQKDHSIDPASGYVGDLTRQKINEIIGN